MSIPATIRSFLTGKGGQFRVRTGRSGVSLDEALSSAKIDPAHLARATLVTDGKARLLAIYPASRELDLEQLGRKFSRTFERSSLEEVGRIYQDCDIDALPPIGEPFGIKVIVDRSFDELEELFFCSGRSGLFIRTNREDFGKLMEGSWRGHHISRERREGSNGERDVMREEVQRITKLPPMPGIAIEIGRLRSNPYASANELAAVIEQDPSLSAQLLRYAASPFYGYQGKIDTVEHAIVRVLGMDFVMDFAFGLSLGKPFRNPKEGPIGLHSFWSHAVYCATLTQALCNSIEFTRRPAPGIAYLAGLMHNFGFLLLGHLFQPQFRRLNEAIAKHPERSVLELEREIMGMSHTDIGLWLMEAWDMPREMVETVREHHNPDVRGEFAIYPQLVFIANRLLKRFDIGDAESVEIPEALLEKIGLSPEQVEAALGAVLEVRDGLDFIAQKMAA